MNRFLSIVWLTLVAILAMIVIVAINLLIFRLYLRDDDEYEGLHQSLLRHADTFARRL